jgi:hypothetical protein
LLAKSAVALFRQFAVQSPANPHEVDFIRFSRRSSFPQNGAERRRDRGVRDGGVRGTRSRCAVALFRQSSATAAGDLSDRMGVVKSKS